MAHRVARPEDNALDDMDHVAQLEQGIMGTLYTASRNLP
jgi:hypothetical protein